MAWKTPRIVEIAVGMEINSYACADLNRAASAAVDSRGGRDEGRRPGSRRRRRLPPVELECRSVSSRACRRRRPWPRTQASLAVSGDGERWFLINASPDLRQQIQAHAILHPRGTCAPRRSRASSSPAPMSMRSPGCCICANASLSPSTPAQRVLAVLKANPIFGVLAPDCVRRQEVALGQPFELQPCRWQRQRTFRSSCSTFRARWRSTSRRAMPRRALRQAGRHGRRRGARGRAAAALHPRLCRHDRRPEAAAGRRVGRAVRRHAVAGRRDDPASGSAPRPASAWGT